MVTYKEIKLRIDKDVIAILTYFNCTTFNTILNYFSDERGLSLTIIIVLQILSLLLSTIFITQHLSLSFSYYNNTNLIIVCNRTFL